MSVLSLPLSILQTQIKKNGKPGFKSKHLTQKAGYSSFLIKPYPVTMDCAFKTSLFLCEQTSPKSAQGKHETSGCRQGVASLQSHTYTPPPPGATSTTHFHSMITKEKLMIPLLKMPVISDERERERERERETHKKQDACRKVQVCSAA